jgi:hypothetical protein
LETRLELAGAGDVVGGEGVVVGVVGVEGVVGVVDEPVGAGVVTPGAAAADGVLPVEELVLSEPLESQPLIIETETLHTNPKIAVRALTLFAIATCSHCCANHPDRQRLSTKLEFTQPAFG